MQMQEEQEYSDEEEQETETSMKIKNFPLLQSATEEKPPKAKFKPNIKPENFNKVGSIPPIVLRQPEEWTNVQRLIRHNKIKLHKRQSLSQRHLQNQVLRVKPR